MAKTQRRKTRKCTYCYVSAKKAARGATQREASTMIICSSCRVPLCVFPCFSKYHIEMPGLGRSYLENIDSNTVQPLNLDICVAWVK